MEYARAVLLPLVCCLLVRGEEPVSSSQVSDRSRYHQQVEFISNYLLQAANHTSAANTTPPNTSSASNTTTPNTDSAATIRQQSPFVDKPGVLLTKDNNTTPNEIQVIPVPVAGSSAIDTLPVHPRIPRRSSGRRRSRNEHRHSTRVFQGQPVRFLLPPFQNEAFDVLLPTTSAPLSTDAIFITTVRAVNITPTMTEATYDHELSENKLELKEPKQSSIPAQHRRVFIPPPLRYLLPPFFYENYINAQSTTSPSPVTQGRTTQAFTLLTEDYYFYPTNSSEPLRNISVESSSLAPIIVIETASQPDDELGDWNYPADRREYTTQATTEYSYNGQKEIEDRRFSTSFIVAKSSSTSKSPQQNSQPFFKNPLQDDYDYEDIANYWASQSSSHPTTQSTISSTTPIPQTSESFGFVYRRYKTTSVANYSSRSTSTTPSTTTTSTSYPFLRGPNIEQALFETGEFQSFNTSDKSEESGDPTLTMMNRPLLAQEVAQAGMKITAHIKKEKINRDNLRRGKSKFRHLNQFNFETETYSRGSKSSQLDVAETSYYNGRRPSTQIIQEADIRAIPGRAGQDYPTLTSPTRTDFSCRSVSYHRGYVADPNTGCQVFYICVGDGPGEPMLCPNGTIFSQDFLVCDWWYNVDCHRQT